MTVRTAPGGKGKGGSKSGGSSKKKSSGGSSGGGGGSGIKKTNDKPALAALEKLLKGGFATARDQSIANIKTLYATQDADLLKGYEDRSTQLGLSRTDNDKAEAGASFANLTNRARETQDVLAQTAEQGAGESDTAKAQLMAIQNWSANQGEVNRSYFDTVRSINNSITDLNADTRTGRINLATGALGDEAKAWETYRNQMVETATQAANMSANPYSDAYKKNAAKDLYKTVVENASTVWQNPGVSAGIKDWVGTEQPVEGNLNNDMVGSAVTVKQQKKPEGSSTGALKAWEG